MTRSLALFIAWVPVGFIGSYGLLYTFTMIGPPILLAILLAYRHLPTIGGSKMPEALGAVGGLGTFLILLATAADGDSSTFALLGALTVAASVLAYGAIGRHRCQGGIATE